MRKIEIDFELYYALTGLVLQRGPMLVIGACATQFGRDPLLSRGGADRIRSVGGGRPARSGAVADSIG